MTRHRTTRLGAILLPQHPPERLPAVARAADAAGLDELWLWEDCFLAGGVAAAAAALAVTDRLAVGVGILPVPLRNVALAAMEIATLRRMFGERAVIGVGHGVQEWMGQVGARAASPLTLLREYATALRALLAGETVDVAGRYVTLSGVALDHPPDPAPGLLVGAVGPKTLRLAGEVGDGLVLVAGTPPDGVRAALATAGRPGLRAVVFVPAATGPDAAQELAGQAARQGWAHPGAGGDAAAVAALVREYAAAGATSVVLQPLPGADPVEFARFAGRDVRARLG